MPSFAELRERAEKAKNAGVSKMSNTRDRWTSTSSKDLDWDPNHKRPLGAPTETHTRNQSSGSTIHTPGPAPPPPPPSRGPPPIRRDTRPDHAPIPSPTPSWTPPVHGKDIDWLNLTPQDKQVFFSWLDEFFGRYLGITIPPRKNEPTIQVVSRPITPPRPPTLPSWSRPSAPSIPKAIPEAFTMSYPPPTTHGSSAADFAQFFTQSSYWESAWYLSSDIPPALQIEKPPTYAAGWESRGSTKTSFGGVIFSDLSAVWYSVQFSTSNPNASPNDGNAVKRSAQYLPRPAPKGQAELVEAHETYGETIAGFAESFEGTGQYCARGECWDLASEALKYFDQYDYVPKPVPSISRTHGHLIYEGMASQNGANQAGRWRGGDDRIRRGDIVEWRTVRMGMSNGGYAMLGDPDHTAVIVTECQPRIAVSDGSLIKPADLGSFEVVEQSVGKPPERQLYELNLMQEGEVWIYRPISMEAYVGVTLQPRCPDGISAISV